MFCFEDNKNASVCFDYWDHNLKQIKINRVESFFNVKYGSSNIKSKSSSKNLSNQNKQLCFWLFVVFKTKPELECQN